MKPMIKPNKLYLVTCSTICLMGMIFSTQAATEEESLVAKEESLVAKEIAAMYKTTPSATKVESSALKKVTDAVIYDVKVKVEGLDRGSSTDELRVIRVAGEVHPLVRPSTNQDCPELERLIKKDFKLKTEEDAKVLEAALDIIYPISEGAFGGRDHKAKAIWREDGRVVLVRGEFFKDLKAFIFEINDSGAITKVTYKLGLKRK